MQTLMGRKGNVLAAQFSLMPSHKVITDCPTEVYVFGTPCSRCAAEVGDFAHQEGRCASAKKNKTLRPGAAPDVF
ncbi:hypothetical protein L914_21673 [Phytophthora nicotianae]|uniref:Uncharacterized protein n=1 Tax=Phytophthora nicotianae TaxID=4792 RepID=W2M2P0_PHYNI|nr:hypothetical protein L914_21673 [Phytophthora nicotianae]